MAKATYDDVNLILRLYDMRREEKLRAARAWFVTNFKPKNMEEMDKLAGPGTDGNAVLPPSDFLLGHGRELCNRRRVE